MKDRHVVIVGGGISGLATAFYLSQDPSLRVTVLEASDGWGGVLRTLRHKDFSIEAAADTFDGSRPEALELCRSLGLTAELIGSEPSLKNLSIRSGSQIFSIPFSARILTSGALDLPAKARMLLAPWISREIGEKDESLGAFLRRRFGAGFVEQVGGPLIRGVIMAEPAELSAREYFPVHKNESKPASQAWMLRGGMDRFVTALVNQLQRGTVLRLHSPVRAIAGTGPWKVALENGEILGAADVCLSMPACRSAALIREAAPELAVALSAIRYDPVAVINLIFNRRDVPPEGRRPGFIVPGVGDKSPFSSLKWVGAARESSWVRAKVFISGVLHRAIFDLSDEAILERVLANLKNEWKLPAPLWTGVERYPQELAQYGPDHRDRVAEIERELRKHPGLYLTGNGFEGFGITDCIRRAQGVAGEISRSGKFSQMR